MSQDALNRGPHAHPRLRGAAGAAGAAAASDVLYSDATALAVGFYTVSCDGVLVGAQ
jgi:hypothetical protein